ncbi:MAG: AzlD domain-containing protein [Eggerthellales bacterium]|nr:AzlD domain-containing protein [Eggerthellales bacterium]
MTFSDFLIVLVGCSLTMVAFRVIPLFALKGKELPETVSKALGLIAPAAFAALIANDLCNPQAMADGFSWVWAAPLIAAIPVAFVGVKTKSMAWCIVAGVGVLAFLMLATGQM